MPDEVGTETTRSDASSADDALFGDAPEDGTAADPAAEKANGEDPQEAQDSGDAGGPADAGAEATADDDAPSDDDLKVVVSVRGGRATIGVQRPSADPHIETFEDRDLPDLAQEVLAVTERARARWEETPKHPAYARPAPQTARRNRRQQGTAQAATAGEEAEQQQQQTLRLF